MMATKDKQYLVEVNTKLTDSLEKQVSALPSDFNKQRFIQNCMTVLQDGNADFSKCAAPTVVRTLLKGAFLGLDFFSGECYAIPYGDKCEFQTDYKGEIKLAKKYSSNPIKDIYAKLVREGDEFEEEIINGQQSVCFRPKAFNTGDIIGAFAVCLYRDGSMIYETMSKADIENTRQSFSKAMNSKAWKNSYGEMCKKTVLRRLCKLIDLDFNSEQIKAYEEGSLMDVKGTTLRELEVPIDVMSEEVIDADSKESDDGSCSE
jgi:recombination protein RecT